MSISQVHEYHFVMNRGMKKALKSLDMYKQTGSLSSLIVKILSLLAPVIEKKHKWGRQKMSRYLPVSDNPAEKREHVHAYIPDYIYRRFKLMHQDLNYYSIAQLVRNFLKLFLVLVKVFGDDIFQVLEKLFKLWKEENGKIQLTVREVVRQLSIILQHLPGQNWLINIYNKQFCPFWTLHP